MTLHDMILRIEAACPGWVCPEALSISDGSGWHAMGDGTSDTIAITPEHAAAIILASVKEWLAGEEIVYEVGYSPMAEKHTALVGGSHEGSADTELEALVGALEAR